MGKFYYVDVERAPCGKGRCVQVTRIDGDIHQIFLGD